MAGRAYSLFLLASAILFAFTLAAHLLPHDPPAFSWLTPTGNLREINCQDGISLMQADAKFQPANFSTGLGDKAQTFFQDQDAIRDLELRRDAVEAMLIETMGRLDDYENVQYLKDHLRMVKGLLTRTIDSDKLGTGPRRVSMNPGKYSEGGRYGLYLGGGLADVLNVPARSKNDPDKIAEAAIVPVHISLIRIRFPLLAILTGALPFARLASNIAIRAKRRHRRNRNRCLSCGYDLRSSPNRCPECGDANFVA